MIKPHKSKKELAGELKIHPRTLSRYMDKLGIRWDHNEPMPPIIWESVVSSLNQEDSPAFATRAGGGRNALTRNKWPVRTSPQLSTSAFWK